MVAIVACPLCGGPADQQIGVCSCGYNAREVAALERELSMWKRRRLISGAVFDGGIAIFMFVPAVSLGVAAGVGGLMVSAGAVLWAWSRYYSGTTKRAIHEARTPKALPEARLL